MKNRGKHDIINSILNSLDKNGPSSRTKIMYRSMLSNTQSTKYISYLEERGIVYEITPRAYDITEKGRQVLQISNEIESMTSNNGIKPKSLPFLIKPTPIVKYDDLGPLPIDFKLSTKTKRKKEKEPHKRGGTRKEMTETAQLADQKVRRNRVLAIWNKGEHNTYNIARLLHVNRGMVYNDLRVLGIKK